MALPAALSALESYPQFILYKSVPSASRPGKTDKFPCSAMSGQVINAHDPANWVTSQVAQLVAPLFGPEYGVGFVLTKNDPFFCLDVDNCATESGWSPRAMELCGAFPGAAVEVSSSGKGLHIWGRGEIPPHSCKNTALGIELYDSGRFIALGMPGAVGDASTDQTAALSSVVPQYFPPSAVVPTPSQHDGWTTAPCAEWRGPPDDNELLTRAMNAKQSAASAFGGKATFRQLWDAEAAALAESYPDPSNAGKLYGASEADAALAAHLAWWTGRDCERVMRMMWLSDLKRDKWEREDYLRRTVLRACAVTTGCYVERQADAAPAPTESEPEADPYAARMVNGHTIWTPEDQFEAWKDYTYVSDDNEVYSPHGQNYGPEGFKGFFGGKTFIIDRDNGTGSATKNALEAFTQNRAVVFRRANKREFRPEMPANSIWDQGGTRVLNSFRKLDTPCKEGDTSLFTEHLAKLLPNERDRTILLSYMAGMIQFPGVKFQWCPLIQGTEGNGKTLLSKCMTAALGREYCHEAKASQIAGQFNSWLLDKMFINVEDVYYPEGKAEVLEVLKPMITNLEQPIREMRKAEGTKRVCANFILNSNHKDALRKSENDRRLCILFTAQQCKADLERDGMTKEYFAKIYQWLEQEGGYAAVTHMLRTFKIPEEFGFTCLMSRAPDTTSTAEAITAGLGRIEQEIVECVIQGNEGMANGWISSTALDRMLIEHRMAHSIPRNKRRDMLATLGYIPHPGLRDGRVTCPLPGKTEKPILFIKSNHWAKGLNTNADIVKTFLAAQVQGAVAVGVIEGIAA